MDAEFYFNRGVERTKKRELQGAIEDYSAAITLSSGSVRKPITTSQPDGSTVSVDVIEESVGTESMYFNRGCAYLDIGNYTAAINDFSKFIEYNENDPEVYFKRAVANYCLENDDEVERDLELATALDLQYNKQKLLAIFRS